LALLFRRAHGTPSEYFACHPDLVVELLGVELASRARDDECQKTKPLLVALLRQKQASRAEEAVSGPVNRESYIHSLAVRARTDNAEQSKIAISGSFHLPGIAMLAATTIFCDD
jgi:hypothetical protein